MKAALLVAAAALIIAAIMAGNIWLASHVPRTHRDHLCPVAEISPDITQAERERCRQLRAIKL
jgi:hypothetical protein